MLFSNSRFSPQDNPRLSRAHFSFSNRKIKKDRVFKEPVFFYCPICYLTDFAHAFADFALIDFALVAEDFALAADFAEEVLPLADLAFVVFALAPEVLAFVLCAEAVFAPVVFALVAFALVLLQVLALLQLLADFVLADFEEVFAPVVFALAVFALVDFVLALFAEFLLSAILCLSLL